MMRILEALASVVYYATALVENGERAKNLAAAHDIRVEVLFPRDLPLPPDAVAQLVDLDNLWKDAHGRQKYVADLAASPPKVPTFLHSYDFDEGDKPGPKNVVLVRRLDEDLMRRVAGLLTTGAAGLAFAPPGAAEPASLGAEEFARIQLGSDGGPLCD